MPSPNDITLNSVGYTVVPGSYRKRSATKASAASRETRRLEIGPFGAGQRQAIAAGARQGWESLAAGPYFDGQGVEPFPHASSFADALADLPGSAARAHAVIAGANAFIGLGQRIYKSVALNNAAWSALSVAADLGAGFTISGLAYYQDDLLVMLGSGQDIRRFNTASSALTIWRAGEKGQVGCGFAGQLVYAPRLPNAREELRLSGAKWNGNAVTHTRYLDSPIVAMALFNGKVAIATRASLYFMGGQPYPGEADDASVTADTSRAPAWLGEPLPVMTHGQFAAEDDFTFLCSYRGRLYTWLAGRVAEFDDSTEEGRWLRIGPEAGAAGCHGAAVVGDWLVIAIAGRYGGHETWGFDGVGWWLLARRASPAMLWPCAVGGAGNRDLLLFRDASTTYDLYRLTWRGTGSNTYAAAASWTSSLLDAGEPARDKSWRAFGATFAAPDDRGNAASVDSVTITLEYSLDGGTTWAAAESLTTAAAARRGFTLQSSFDTAVDSLPSSRHLQLRVSWSSVSDWAPVLVSIWADYVILDNAPPRRRWELVVDASDRNPRRDGNLDPQRGRQKIAALWDAWEAGQTLGFQEADEGLWDPSRLRGLALWLKADSLSGLLDGDGVALWPDAAGNGVQAAQSVSANQPRYRIDAQNGLPVVRFDGNWLVAGSTLGIDAQPFSQFTVWKPGGPGQALMIWANNTGLLVTDFDDDVGIFSGSALFDFNTHPFGQWHVIAGVHNGASGSLTVDGGASVTGATGTNVPAGALTIGAGIAGADRWLTGDLGELILTRTALTADEQERLEGYAAHKWGLAASLPSDHPYRNAPPLAGYRVRIEEIEERVGKPNDAARWGQSQIALTLAEV